MSEEGEAEAGAEVFRIEEGICEEAERGRVIARGGEEAWVEGLKAKGKEGGDGPSRESEAKQDEGGGFQIWKRGKSGWMRVRISHGIVPASRARSAAVRVREPERPIQTTSWPRRGWGK